ncbi:MAG: PorT family protein [Bacteroidetes bacterium]|nr:PorT family protein [Bacteroidota bacterium]
MTYIRKAALFLIFLMIFAQGFAQKKDSSDYKKFIYGISGGLNYSRLTACPGKCYYGTHPAVGLYTKYHLRRNFALKGTVLYSQKGSITLEPHTKYRNAYLDVHFLSQWQLVDGLYIQGGVSFSRILDSKKVVPDGTQWNGLRSSSIPKDNSEVNLLAGFELRVLNRSNLEFNCFYPINRKNVRNFQLTLNISLNHKAKQVISYRKIRKHAAREQIQSLKSGTLLVRLKTSATRINAMEKIGKTAQAEQIRMEQDLENKKIISAFQKHFDFCKVLFFYSPHSRDVKEKRVDGIFLDGKLQVGPSIRVDTSKPIFIAEFGAIEPDTIKFFSGYRYETARNWGIPRIRSYYSPSADFDFYALVIMDDQFVQLKRPFPYYTRTIYRSIRKEPVEVPFIAPLLPFLTWSYDRTVERMNRKLSGFHH